MARLGPQDARVWVDGMDLRERGFLTRLEHGDEASFETERVFGRAHSAETPTGRTQYALALGGYFDTHESLRRLVGSTKPTNILGAVGYSANAGAAFEFAGSLEIRNRNIVTPPEGLARIDADMAHAAGVYRTDATLIHLGEVTGDGDGPWVDLGAALSSGATVALMIDGGDGYNASSAVRLDLYHSATGTGNGSRLTQYRLDMAAGSARASGIFTRTASINRYVRVDYDLPSATDSVRIFAAIARD